MFELKPQRITSSSVEFWSHTSKASVSAMVFGRKVKASKRSSCDAQGLFPADVQEIYFQKKHTNCQQILNLKIDLNSKRKQYIVIQSVFCSEFEAQPCCRSVRREPRWTKSCETLMINIYWTHERKRLQLFHIVHPDPCKGIFRNFPPPFWLSQ